MATNERYNGFANFETWAIALWLDNDEATYKHWQYRAAGARRLADKQTAVEMIANALKTSHDSDVDNLDLPPCWISDLLAHAFNRVDWLEVAEHIIGDDDDDKGEDAQTMIARNLALYRGRLN